MTKRERVRILRNVRQMYIDINRYNIGGARMMALEALTLIVAVMFRIPRKVTKEYLSKKRIGDESIR